MGVSRMTLHRLLKERTRVTPTMALRLGRYCGNGADIWLRLQDAHDLWLAEREFGEENAGRSPFVSRYSPPGAEAPSSAGDHFG
ncbi:MAG: HigA family addiction module antitoxin [Halofilum sp. (in: g-proteobacteria)]|nr:HigA family addiction module antitoxin [Halofilum sp. (in: g-proteobacteria)]